MAADEKVAHTPGPWIALPAEQSAERGVIEIGIKAGPYFNHVVTYGDGGAQQQADARLIAAAPDLLAALEPFANMGDANIAADIRKALRPHERESFDAAVGAARLAIAKAKGR